MTKAEQEQQQRTFGPCPERRRASRGDQHQRVDLETFELQVLDRFSDGVEAAEEVRAEIAGERQPTWHRRQFFDCESRGEECTADQGEDQLAIGAEDAAMMVVGIFAALASVAVRLVPMCFGLAVHPGFCQRYT